MDLSESSRSRGNHESALTFWAISANLDLFLTLSLKWQKR